MLWYLEHYAKADDPGIHVFCKACFTACNNANVVNKVFTESSNMMPTLIAAGRFFSNVCIEEKQDGRLRSDALFSRKEMGCSISSDRLCVYL